MWKQTYSDDEVTYVPCPLCGEDQPNDIAIEWSLIIAECGSCEMRYVRRHLREPDFTYKSGTETSVIGKYGGIISEPSRHPREANYQQTLDRLEPYRNNGRLLDVGPHLGFFMHCAKTRGWQVVGVEPSPILASLARDKMGLDVRTGYLGEATIGGSYDVVTFTDVLEHVPNPIEVLRLAADAVAGGGVVLAKVPHAKWNHMKYLTIKRLFGNRVDAYDSREHLLHFTGPTLRTAFKRAGLEPLELFVPRPIQAGGPLKKGLRWLAWRLGNLANRIVGSPTFLSPDLVLIGRRAF